MFGTGERFRSGQPGLLAVPNSRHSPVTGLRGTRRALLRSRRPLSGDHKVEDTVSLPGRVLLDLKVISSCRQSTRHYRSIGCMATHPGPGHKSIPTYSIGHRIDGKTIPTLSCLLNLLQYTFDFPVPIVGVNLGIVAGPRSKENRYHL